MQLRDFWLYVDDSAGVDACWPWTRAINKNGYGSVWINGQSMTASRLAYQLARGHIPNHPTYHGIVVRHTCDNRKCCNPDHLILGTQAENNADRDYRGRIMSRPRGEANHASRLDISRVLKIKSLRADGHSLSQVATMVGCSKGAVAHVCNGRTWAWLEREGLSA